jgi:HrpA-like RNA helicase
MKRFPEPSIRVSDISEECLKLLSSNLNNNTEMTVDNLIQIFSEFIEPPREPYLKSALLSLMQIGLVENNKISKLGILCNQIGGTDYKLNLAMIFGLIYKCSYEIQKIASLISVSKMRISEIINLPANVTSTDIREKYKKVLTKFKNNYGDHIALLNIYDKYKNNQPDTRREWAFTHFVKVDTMRQADNNLRKYKGNIQTFITKREKHLADDIAINYRDDIANLPLNDRILTCFLMAYQTQVAYKVMGTTIYNTQLVKDKKIQVDSNSFLNQTNDTKNIIYGELFVSMNNMTLNIVSNIPNVVQNLFM